MKKITGSILTAAVCVGLSLTAFTLSGFASIGMKTGTVNVMEKETPKEYMADFSVDEEQLGKQPDIAKYLNTIFISEGQTDLLKKNTEEILLEAYGVKLPQDLKFEYYTSDFDGIKIFMNWSDGRDNYRDSIYFNAVYEVVGSQGSTLSTILKSINIKNGYDIKSLDIFKKQSLQALKDELEIEVPEHFSVFTNVSINFDNSRQSSVSVHFDWAKDNLRISADNYVTPCYTVGFDKVDLSKNTGELTMVEDDSVLKKLLNRPDEIFTKTQQEEIVKTARQFFEDKGIIVEDLVSRGGVTRSYVFEYNGGKGMWLVFNSVEKNSSSRGYIEIFITSKFDVLGYAY